MLAQPDRRRRRAAGRSPTISISAIPRSRRSWASWSPPSKASARPARPSPSRSSPAMSRSTTRPTARRSCRPRRIGGVGLIADVTPHRPHRLCRRGRGHPAGRRAGQLGHPSRPVGLAARNPRPRGRPAAAGRSRPREAGRRLRPRPHPRRAGHRRPRLLRRRAGGGARRDGHGVGHRRHRQPAHRRIAGRGLLRRGSGPLCRHRPRGRSERVWERAGKAGSSPPWIGNTGGSELKLGEAAGIPLAKLAQAYETWFPDYMAGGARDPGDGRQGGRPWR